MYYTYILLLKELDKFHIGSAKNVEERLTKHLTNHNGFTRKVKDWSVEYSEQFESKFEAQIRENQIKKWKSSAMIRDLIRNRNRIFPFPLLFQSMSSKTWSSLLLLSSIQ